MEVNIVTPDVTKRKPGPVRPRLPALSKEAAEGAKALAHPYLKGATGGVVNCPAHDPDSRSVAAICPLRGPPRANYRYSGSQFRIGNSGSKCFSVTQKYYGTRIPTDSHGFQIQIRVHKCLSVSHAFNA